jgi:hypothetical protein
MCLLLAPASKGKLLLFFSFFVTAANDSTTEANKAPLSSLYSLDVYAQLQKDFLSDAVENIYILNNFRPIRNWDTRN